MASIALIVCLGFIAWLLWRECRRRNMVSSAIWIPTLLLMVLGSRPLSMWLGSDLASGNDAERSPVDQAFFFLILASSFAIAASRRVKWGKFFASNLPLVMFYGFFAISILWSGDPIGSTKRLSKDFGMLFVIAVILSDKYPLQAIRTVYVRCACVLFPLSVVFIRWFPNMARSFTIAGEPMYTGVTTQKNTLGEIILIFGSFLIWDILETSSANTRGAWIKKSWDRLLLLAMGIWLLNMSQSKTALLCLLIAGALTLRSGWLISGLINRVVLFGALSLPYCMFFAQQFSSVIAPIVEAMGRNMTFTGRTDIWDHITAKTVNPLIGAGYWNFWGGPNGLAIGDAMHTPIPNAHCGYLDIYLDGGIIGLCVLFVLLLASGLKLIQYVRYGAFQRLRFAILIAVIVYNLSESAFGRLSTIWFTTLLVIITFPVAKSVAKRQASAQRPPGSKAVSSPPHPQFVTQLDSAFIPSLT